MFQYTTHNWNKPQKNGNLIQRTLGGFSRLPEPTGFSRWGFSSSIIYLSFKSNLGGHSESLNRFAENIPYRIVEDFICDL